MTYFNLDGFMASGGRGGWQSPRPVEMCKLWPWLDAEPEIVTLTGVGLHRIFSDANLRWKEEQTKRRIIYPVLTNFLGFSALDLSETMDPGLR